MLTGRNTKRIRDTGHASLPAFGCVTEFQPEQLREIIACLLHEKLLARADSQYPTLSVTARGRQMLEQETPIRLPEPEAQVTIAKRARKDEDQTFDGALFEELRVLRHTLAKAQGVAAFVIFGDRTLREMAAYFPQQEHTFRQLYGVSERKFAAYGDAFLRIIRRFAETHGKEEQPIPMTKPTRPERAVRIKGSTYEETRQLVLQKIPLSEIASRRGLKEGTVIKHIRAIAAEDPTLDIDHLKPSAAMLEEIAHAFRTLGSSILSPVFQKLKGKYSYDQLRLASLFWEREHSLHS